MACRVTVKWRPSPEKFVRHTAQDVLRHSKRGPREQYSEKCYIEFSFKKKLSKFPHTGVSFQKRRVFGSALCRSARYTYPHATHNSTERAEEHSRALYFVVLCWSDEPLDTITVAQTHNSFSHYRYYHHHLSHHHRHAPPFVQPLDTLADMKASLDLRLCWSSPSRRSSSLGSTSRCYTYCAIYRRRLPRLL